MKLSSTPALVVPLLAAALGSGCKPEIVGLSSEVVLSVNATVDGENDRCGSEEGTFETKATFVRFFEENLTAKQHDITGSCSDDIIVDSSGLGHQALCAELGSHILEEEAPLSEKTSFEGQASSQNWDGIFVEFGASTDNFDPGTNGCLQYYDMMLSASDDIGLPETHAEEAQLALDLDCEWKPFAEYPDNELDCGVARATWGTLE